MEVSKIPQSQSTSQKVQKTDRVVSDVTFDQVFAKSMKAQKKEEPVSEKKPDCESKAPQEAVAETAEEKPSDQRTEEKTEETLPKENYEAAAMALKTEILTEVLPEIKDAGTALEEQIQQLEQTVAAVPLTALNQEEQPVQTMQPESEVNMENLADAAEKLSGKQAEAVRDSLKGTALPEGKSKTSVQKEPRVQMEVQKMPKQSDETSEPAGNDVTETLKGQAEVLKSMAPKKVSGSGKEESIEKISAKPVDVDKVQEQVDSKAFFNQGEAALRNLTGSYRTPYVDTKDVKESMPVPEQLTRGISQGISKELQMFSIRLKPEGMGEVIVHLASAGGRIAMSIGVTNTETQKMLSSEMANLKEMLRPLNAEVKEIYQSEPDGFDMMTYQQNFYQQQRQQFYAKLQSSRQVDLVENDVEAGVISEQAVQRAVYADGNLNAYV